MEGKTDFDKEVDLYACYGLVLALVKEYSEERGKREGVEPSEIENKIVELGKIHLHTTIIFLL